MKKLEGFLHNNRNFNLTVCFQNRSLQLKFENYMVGQIQN